MPSEPDVACRETIQGAGMEKAMSMNMDREFVLNASDRNRLISLADVLVVDPARGQAILEGLLNSSNPKRAIVGIATISEQFRATIDLLLSAFKADAAALQQRDDTREKAFALNRVREHLLQSGAAGRAAADALSAAMRAASGRRSVPAPQESGPGSDSKAPVK